MPLTGTYGGRGKAVVVTPVGGFAVADYMPSNSGSFVMLAAIRCALGKA
jgi:hypothetical protein